jgi:hypothetical protein
MDNQTEGVDMDSLTPNEVAEHIKEIARDLEDEAIEIDGMLADDLIYKANELRDIADSLARRAEPSVAAADVRALAADLLQYLDEHDWGGIPECSTADQLRAALASPAVSQKAAPEAPAGELVYQMRNRLGGPWTMTDADGATALKRMPQWADVYEFRTLQVIRPAATKASVGYSKEWAERMLKKELDFGGNIEAGATTASASIADHAEKAAILGSAAQEGK